MITLVLPLPPSVNAAYRNVRGKGRAKTQKFKDWEADAGVYLMQQREWKKQKVTGPYELEIRVPKDMRGDISNRIKAVEDLLVSIEATADDKHAQRVSIERSPDVPEFDCYVCVKPAYDANDDFAKSLDEGYRVIRERVAAGGPCWKPKGAV